MKMDSCYICKKNVRQNQKGISCTICYRLFHVALVGEVENNVTNLTCLGNIFPFNHIDNDSDFPSVLHVQNKTKIFNFSNSEKFSPFEIDEYKHLLNNPDIDPDKNYYSVSELPDSVYVTSTEFNKIFDNKKYIVPFSVLHIVEVYLKISPTS